LTGTNIMYSKVLYGLFCFIDDNNAICYSFFELIVDKTLDRCLNINSKYIVN